MGRDYSYCWTSKLTDSQVSGLVFSWFLKNTAKNEGLIKDFFEAHAPDWIRWPEIPPEFIDEYVCMNSDMWFHIILHDHEFISEFIS